MDHVPTFTLMTDQSQWMLMTKPTHAYIELSLKQINENTASKAGASNAANKDTWQASVLTRKDNRSDQDKAIPTVQRTSNSDPDRNPTVRHSTTSRSQIASHHAAHKLGQRSLRK